MRVAVVADIHGNLPALEAVLTDIAGRGVGRVVCLGDVAATGPQPHEVAARLHALGIRCVMGNADAWLLDPPAADSDGPADKVAARVSAIDRWCAGRLTDDDRAYLLGFAPTIEVPLDGPTRLLCCHGSPRSFDEGITATTAADELDAMLAGADAAVIAGGHTHVALVRRHRATIWLNPGSVGLPLDRTPPATDIRNPAWAEYAIVEAAGARLGIELLRVPYALAPLLAAARAAGMPHADWWAGDWVAAEGGDAI